MANTQTWKSGIAVYKYEQQNVPVSGIYRVAFESSNTVPHTHENFYEIMLVTKGTWKNITSDGVFTLSTGSLTLFQPGVSHQLSTVPNKNQHFVICLDTEYFESYASRVFPGLDLRAFPSIVSMSISEERQKYLEYLGSSIINNTLFLELAANEIIHVCLSQLYSLTYSSPNLDFVLDIIQKLDSFFYINHTVEEICSNYPCSKTVLMNQFKQKTGITLVKYKTMQKLKYACQLLSTTDIKISDISGTLQYSSLSYFLRRFKEEYGVTPSEYRESHRKDAADGSND